MGEVPQQSGETIATHSGKPWGFWGTMGFAILVLLLFFLVQTLVGFGFLYSVEYESETGAEQTAQFMMGNGLLLAVATCTTGVICTLTILLLARLRRGISVGDYLALTMPTGRSFLLWLGIAVAVVFATDAIRVLAGRDMVPEFLVEAYRSAVYPPLLWLALVVAAPVFEETLFRGFLFRGWMDTRLRETGTILLTSATWCLLHFHYDIAELLAVLALGIVLGYARSRTGSLVTPLVIHALVNFLATMQVALLE